MIFMLLGTYYGVLSPKRRTAVPASFRKLLGETLIIAKWYEECLVLVSVSEWDALLKRLTANVGTVTAPVRDTDRFILGSAFSLTADEQGRVVIPEILATYAGLGTEIAFLGLGDRVEIWNKENWGKREKLIAQNASQLLENVANEKRKEKGGIS